MSIVRLFDKTVEGAAPGAVRREEIYAGLNLPRGADHPSRRPYTAINMVTTVDGKIVVGGPGTTRLIGTATDHFLMGHIEFQADAVLLGAGVVRTDDPPYPRMDDDRQRRRAAMGLRPNPLWATVSTAGEFPHRPRLFDGGRDNTALFTTRRIDPARRAALEQETQVFVCGDDAVDPLAMGRILRDELGTGNMFCLGGAALNATLVEAGAADELFVTLAPKLQGGTRLPTILEGTGYPAERLPALDLLSAYADGSELYLRYRLPPTTRRAPELTVPDRVLE